MRPISSSVTRWKFRTYPSLAQMIQHCAGQPEGEEFRQYAEQYTEVAGILTATEAGVVLRSYLGEAPGACHEYFVAPYLPEPEIELLDSPETPLADAEDALQKRMDDLNRFCRENAVMALYMCDAQGALAFQGVFAQKTWEESYLPHRNVAINTVVPEALIMSFLQAGGEPPGSASTLQAAMWRVVRETRVCNRRESGSPPAEHPARTHGA
jgi:hypothetical protein